MAWYWWLAIVAGGYGCFALRKALKKAEAAQGALEAAIKAHIGRAPDYFYHLRSHAPGPSRIMAAFVDERKIYVGEYAEPFSPSHFLGPADVRNWGVQWDTGIDDRGRTYRRRFSLHVAVRSVDTPLIKIDCQDEATVHKVQEIYNQAFGEREVAATV